MLFIVIIVVVIPTVIVKGFPRTTLVVQSTDLKDENTGIDIVRQVEDPEIMVYDHTTKKVIKMPLEQYVVGVVAGEMPVSFELEALKAQAVAARTLAVGKMKSLGGKGCTKYPEADVCSLFSHCQAWISDEQQQKNWGQGYEQNRNKIIKAVQETYGDIITYDNAPIEVFFHSTSNGKTEDAGEVFSHSLPYYTVVESRGEENGPKYRQTFTLSNTEFVKIFKSRYPKSNLISTNLSSQIRIKNHTASGRVGELEVGGITVKGTDFRYLYGLNSTDFKFQFEKDKVKIHTIGYGHGVGMSQIGANYMAQKGYTYIEILKHYYKGVEVEKHK